VRRNTSRRRRAIESHESGVIRLDGKGSTRRTSRHAVSGDWGAPSSKRRLRRANLPNLNGPELRALLREFFGDEAGSIERNFPFPVLSREGMTLLRRLLDCLYEVVNGVPSRMKQVLLDQGEDAGRVSQLLSKAFAADLGSPDELQQYRYVIEEREARQRVEGVRTESESRRNRRIAEVRERKETEERKRAQAEARRRAEVQRQAEAQRRAQAEAQRQRAEAEARCQAEAARLQAEEEARRQAEEEARRQAEEEARRQAEEAIRERQAELERSDDMEAFKRGMAEDFGGFGED
jgi:hypothetical protein